MTVLQAMLIGVVCAFSMLEGGWLGECKLREPVVTGFLVGLILSDVKQGLIIGAQLELIWMGTASIGPVAGLAVGPGGTIGTAIALVSGAGIEAAMMFGVPVSVLMQFLQSILDTTFSFPMHTVEKLIDEGGGERQIIFIHYLYGIIQFFIYFLLTFVVLYFGNDVILGIVDNLPGWANSGLAAVSVVLPSLGFALLLNLLLEQNLVPYFAIGFVLAAYLGLSMVGVAIVSTALAGIIYLERTYAAKNAPQTVPELLHGFDDEEEGDEL